MGNVDSLGGTPTGHRCGVVAIAGRPNVGKSTLLNAILRTKVAIVTPKPQTTRDRIIGILTRPGFQILFQDTPGAFDSSLSPALANRALNRRMTKEAVAALADCDVVLAMSDIHEPQNLDKEEPLMQQARGRGKPIVFAVNKIDLVAKIKLLPLIDEIHKRWHPEAVVPVSALTGDGLEDLVGEIVRRLPEGPPLYPEDQVSDKPIRFLAAEIIREKIFLFTRQELPYSTAVRIDAFEEARPPTSWVTRISATILVEKPSQKKIVIGKNGSLLKRIGTAAREEIEALLYGEPRPNRREKVFLELYVKVDEDWTWTEAGLKRAGI